ncbi:MAG TPA: D-alanyl-D-alanine carboxypeptidase family protein [Patescibacteria group bacterium]|nr:D-alanyl-D-alanine carboxypeptidase family protein [Patescibacteria group bacterium]
MNAQKSPPLFLFQATLRRFSVLFLILIGVSLTLAAAPAQAKYASMVVDADTGEVLHSVNPDNRNYPASLTKMMTLYLLFDALDSGKVHLSDRMPVSAHAAGQAPSKLNLRPGQTLEVEDAVLGLCTKSANDAAVTVGEFLGGSEPAFAEIMTRKARELGMRQTTFRNASGLPNLGQMSTARDMITLARALIHNHAKQYHYFSTRQFTYNGATLGTHNHLMEHYEGADGIKTGYIAASGFNLVASAKRNGRRLIGVVFGGQSAAARDRHMAQLLDEGFARTPGSSGVELADTAEQPDAAEVTAATADDEMPAAPAAKHDATFKMAAVEPPAADYQSVMKAMAQAKAGHVQLASATPAAKPRRRAEPVEAGDSEDEDDDDNWGIQVGAYAQQAKAKAAANSAAHMLGKLVSDGEVDVARSKGHGNKIFRARVIGLPEDTAREACRRLARKHSSCAVVNAGVNVASR